jgi:hypothetical protein
MATDNFYPSMSNTPADTSNTQHVPGDDFAAAQKLYGGTANRDNVLNDPTADAGHPVEAVEAHNNAWRHGLGVIEVSDYEGKQLTELVQLHGRTAPTEDQKAAWWRETSENFARRYGPKEGRERIELAKQFAKRDPTFVRTIDRAGLGGHPRVVEILAERAWSARLAGRM